MKQITWRYLKTKNKNINMSFIKNLIPWKKVLVIDIGTYKVKTAIVEYKNGNIFLIWYSEQKQEPLNIIWSEIADISWVCHTIERSVDKLTNFTNSIPKDIFINIPSSKIISFSKTIKYERQNPDEQIDMAELDYIIWKVERKALDESKKEIALKTGYVNTEIKLITSSITSIFIDNLPVSNPIWFTWKDVIITTLNIFIPSSRYNIIQAIKNELQKNIISIIPLEFSIPKIFEYSDYAFKDIIFIDVWNIQTCITVQKKWEIIWTMRFEIWMNNLIKNIKEKTNKSTLQIIEELKKEKNDFQNEINEFLSVWGEWYLISLKEIIKDKILPENIFISWWWDNYFLKEFLKNIDVKNYNLYKTKNFCIIDVDLSQNIIFKGEKLKIEKYMIWIFSMILAWKEIITSKESKINLILRNFLDKNRL